MRCSKKIILFLTWFATVFSLMVGVASAEWSADVGYYGNVPFQVLIDVRDAANNIIDDQYHKHRLEVAFDTDLQCYRLRYTDSGAWYLHVDGSFPYTIAQGDIETNVSSPSVQSANGWWLPSELSDNVEIKSLSLLESICANLITDGHECRLVETLRFGGRHWVIQDYSTDGGSNRIYGTSDKRAYAAIVGDSATDIERDYLDADGDSVGGTKVLDINGNTFTVIDDSGAKINLDIGSLNYDAGDQSYTVNAYNTINEGDEYYYTYYTYNITYNIANTYVTYIGSNDAYDKKEYEYYYQLPDGRSSADLTADEIAGMSFEFHDVVNYERSATDVSVRALYHFDGDTNDSSYFSTQGKFEWTNGASITYMEAPEAFDGTLYLDNTAHSFDITLPSKMGSADYTIQFRYYQASEPDTQDNIDNYIAIGTPNVIAWDEQSFSRGPDGEYGSWSLPVGTWNEIALVRNNSKLYVYLNGLCVYQEPYIISWGDTITFNFGSASRAYSMIDELRILNFAVAEGGSSYTPTAVPYDSNLVLVLPDAAKPIADEYWSFNPEGNLLTNYDFTTSTDHSEDWYYSPSTTTVAYGDVCSITNNSTLDLASTVPDYCAGYGSVGGTRGDFVPSNGLVSSLGRMSINNNRYFNWMANGYFYRPDLDSTYTLSVVGVDGKTYSHTFTVGAVTTRYDDGIVGNNRTYTEFDWGYLFYYRWYDGGPSNMENYHSIGILPKPGVTFEFVYAELVPGSAANEGHEKVTCVYPESSVQPNTAAVQSEIPVKGYTVGGVRPTLPAKGDVWFPVQENRIQACYIYTGSMWQEVGCRWYTGSRWIPIYAFDLTTLEDLFDIADASDAIVPIISESGFWRWWQLQWLDFRNYLDSKFDELIAAITGGSVGSGADITVPDEEGNSKFSFSDLAGAVLSSLLEIATTVLTEFIGLIADLIKMFIQAVMDFIGGFVGVLSDAAGHIATLGDSVAPIGDFVSGIYAAIPDPIEDVLTGSFVVIVAVSVISFLL